jgi:DNA-binding CsgD family transcriptional regulator
MTQLIGRASEVAASVGVITGTGPDLAVLIEGTPGIGKTVVLDAAIDAARAAGALVLQTRPSEAEGHMAFLGLHDLLAPALSEALPTLPAPQRARIEAAIGIGAAPEGDGHDEGRLAIAVLGALRSLAARRRLVLAIDDLQWLDPSSAAVLDVTLGRLREADVRVVAARREGADARGRLDLPRLFRDRVVTVRLGGLTIGELHRLLTERLGEALARPALLRVHEISRGNAFHALELARSLGPGGAPGPALRAAVPADVALLLRRRLATLPRSSRDLVTLVALSPRPSNETLARVLDITLDELDERAAAPIAAGLLSLVDRGLALAHPLVGSAARQELGQRTIQAWHRRLAAAVADDDEAAVHLSLGTTQPDENVAAALERAARRGLGRGATIDAIDQLDRTIQLTPDGHADALVRRRLLLVRALVLAGDTRRAGAVLDRLEIDDIGDPSMRADAVLLLGVVQRFLGEHVAAMARHEDALRWTTDDRLRARLHMRLAWLSEWDLARALEHAEQALALLDPAIAALDYSFVLLLTARLRLHLGLAADHDAVRRGSELQAAAAERDWNLSTTPIDWAIWMEDWPGARAQLDAAARAAELAGDETLGGALLRRRIEAETWAGGLGLARDLVETAVEQAESTQQVPAIASARARRALVLAQVGDIDAAGPEADEAYRLAEAFGSPVVLAYAATSVASVALARGQLHRVDEVLSRATAALDASGDIDHSAHRFHADHLDALIGLGELERARALADRLERRGDLGPRPTWSGVAARGRASIAAAEGDIEAASGHIERALAFHAGPTVPIESARTHVAAAEIERRRGRRKAAASELGAAIEILQAIGAAGLAGRVRRDLALLTGDRSDRHTLTPSQQRIATLASEGLRNREIATRLGISEKTVEAALGHAYEKLQIRSRAQLSAALRASEDGTVASTS